MDNGSETDSHTGDVAESLSHGLKPRKRALPPSRIALLIFVAGSAVVIALELRARTAFNATYESVETAISAGDKDAEPLYREDLDTILRGSPAREADEVDGRVKEELFTWRGVLQTYRMRLLYGRGGFVMGVQQE